MNVVRLRSDSPSRYNRIGTGANASARDPNKRITPAVVECRIHVRPGKRQEGPEHGAEENIGP
jgi:hypothetical protein